MLDDTMPAITQSMNTISVRDNNIEQPADYHNVRVSLPHVNFGTGTSFENDEPIEMRRSTIAQLQSSEYTSMVDLKVEDKSASSKVL